jgi:hypothetical protein
MFLHHDYRFRGRNRPGKDRGVASYRRETVSRYIHPNPVRAGLVERPEHRPWSSDPGYVEPRRRLPWVGYETLLAAWSGEHGGDDPVAAYRRFVEAGLSAPPPSPSRETFGGWALGSSRCVAILTPAFLTPAFSVLRGVRPLLTAVNDSRLPSPRPPEATPAYSGAWLCRR